MPVTLVSTKACLLWVATCGLCSVAVWMTAVTPSICARTKPGSTIEPAASVKGDAFRSIPRAGDPRRRSVRRMASPRWPALPVTRIVILDPSQPPAAWKTTARPDLAGCSGKNWSGRRGSNPRPRPWQGRALPLSYTRILCRSRDAPATAVVCQKRAANATATGGINSLSEPQYEPEPGRITPKRPRTAESAPVD